MSRLTPPLALLTFLAAFPPAASARAEPGTLVPNVEMATLAGTREKLLSPRAKANVFVFFRANQERSVDALKQIAACQKELAGKPVHWVAVVSSTEVPAEVRATVAQAGISVPVLLDQDDALYGQLGVTMHPMVAIVDAKSRLVTMEPYRQIEYCQIIKTHVKVLLGEATRAQLDDAINPESSELPGADVEKKALRDVNMARKLLELDEAAEAVKFAQKALALAPIPDAYSVLGRAYAKQGKCAEAKRAFAQALKLNPGDKVAVAGDAGCP